MIDTHCHVVFGVDDGAVDLDDGVEMVKEAVRMGITDIIATPHFHRELFESENIGLHFERLLFRCRHLNIRIKLGYEIFADEHLVHMLMAGKRLTMGDSRFILVEMPYDTLPECMDRVVIHARLQKMTPIIAHPERNRVLQNNSAALEYLIRTGCLLQLDAASVAGVYGKNVRSFAQKIITAKMAFTVASNAHCPADYERWYHKSYENVVKWAGSQYAQRLYCENPSMLFANHTIQLSNAGMEKGEETAWKNCR